MPGIFVNPAQQIEKALRAFKKQVEKAGIMKELKNRKHYLKPSVRKKLKSKEARKRNKKEVRYHSDEF
tara:strand:- start:216 stop:419 length:204 start_codon:yes stop_codon:yes gene_type:complete